MPPIGKDKGKRTPKEAANKPPLSWTACCHKKTIQYKFARSPGGEDDLRKMNDVSKLKCHCSNYIRSEVRYTI